MERHRLRPGRIESYLDLWGDEPTIVSDPPEMTLHGMPRHLFITIEAEEPTRVWHGAVPVPTMPHRAKLPESGLLVALGKVWRKIRGRR